MAPRETENNAYMQNFGVTNEEYYDMLCFFLEWSKRKMTRKPRPVVRGLKVYVT